MEDGSFRQKQTAGFRVQGECVQSSVWVFWEDGRNWVMSVGLWEGERWQMEALRRRTGSKAHVD